MNYNRIYNQIIENAKSKNRCRKEEYLENHHIIPKCVGGSNYKQNLVLLTAKEHFICHHLLTKIYKSNDKIKYAFWNMLVCESANQQRYKNYTSTTYQKAKEDFSEIQSQKWKKDNPNNNRSNKGKNNPMYGVHRFGEKNPFFQKKHSEETKQIIGQKNKNKIRTEQHKKNMSDSWLNRPIISCPYCNTQSIHQANMNRYHFDKCKLKPLT